VGVVIDIISGPRGSNPGGTCKVHSLGSSFEGYFKYCYGMRIQGVSSFFASHQPIYEATTFQLVRELGLKTTDFYVLLNRDKQVQFRNWRQFRIHDPSGRDFYFVSRIIQNLQECPEDKANSLIRQASPYLNSILVADIIGKRQNYKCLQCSSSQSAEIFYLDLGCSFVYAKEGYLSLPHKSPPYDSRDFRAILRRLSNYSIISLRKKTINLEELVESIQTLHLPTLNPTSNVSLSALLSTDEINEIQSYIAHNLLNSISSLRQSGILLNGNNSLNLINDCNTEPK